MLYNGLYILTRLSFLYQHNCTFAPSFLSVFCTFAPFFLKYPARLRHYFLIQFVLNIIPLGSHQLIFCNAHVRSPLRSGRCVASVHWTISNLHFLSWRLGLPACVTSCLHMQFYGTLCKKSFPKRATESWPRDNYRYKCIKKGPPKRSEVTPKS